MIIAPSTRAADIKMEPKRQLHMIQATAYAAGIIRACEPVNQSAAVDFLTAPGKPGASVFLLLVVFIPRYHAKCRAGFTLQL